MACCFSPLGACGRRGHHFAVHNLLCDHHHLACGLSGGNCGGHVADAVRKEKQRASYSVSLCFLRFVHKLTSSPKTIFGRLWFNEEKRICVLTSQEGQWASILVNCWHTMIECYLNTHQSETTVLLLVTFIPCLFFSQQSGWLTLSPFHLQPPL